MLNAIYEFLIIYSLFDFVFFIKIRQCDYCLDSFACSFMIAPMFWLYDLEFLLEKSLSVKVPINKDNFEIMGEFLVRWKFDFWVMKRLKCLILVGFDDMGYDKWFGMRKFGFCLILLGFWKIGERLNFLVGVWINQL